MNIASRIAAWSGLATNTIVAPNNMTTPLEFDEWLRSLGYSPYSHIVIAEDMQIGTRATKIVFASVNHNGGGYWLINNLYTGNTVSTQARTSSQTTRLTDLVKAGDKFRVIDFNGGYKCLISSLRSLWRRFSRVLRNSSKEVRV